MARYGRDYDRDRWGMQGNEGGLAGGAGFYGGGDRFGSHWRGAQGGGQGGARDWREQSGGMGADAQDMGGEWGESYHRGRSGMGTGGGAYDQDYGSGWAGNTGSWRTGGLSRGGYGGDYYSGASYGYNTNPGSGSRDYYGAGAGSGYEYGGGRDVETGGGIGNDWGARDTGWGGGSLRGGGQQRGGGSQQQDETRRMRAVDIMTENPECVTPETTLADAAAKMRDLDVGIIPVVDSEQNRRLRGVVTDRDITIRGVAEGMDARSTKVSDVMTTEVESCNKNDSVGDIMRVMEREQVRRVPITDREGRLVGIVAQADVVLDIDSPRGEHRVNDTLERISEPARGRGGSQMRGSQSRAGGGFGQGSGNRSSGMSGGSGGTFGGSGNRTGGSSGGMSAGGRGTTSRTGAEGMGSASNLGDQGGQPNSQGGTSGSDQGGWGGTQSS